MPDAPTQPPSREYTNAEYADFQAHLATLPKCPKCGAIAMVVETDGVCPKCGGPIEKGKADVGPILIAPQPPSPAQRIEAAVESLRPRKCDDMGETDAALATVRAALKEMEDDYQESRERTLGILRRADLRAKRAEGKIAYLRDHLADAMRIRKLGSGGQIRDVHNQAIDTCIEVLKEGFE